MAGPVASYKQLGFGLYLVALKETGVPIGICGLLKRESMQDIEIGFALLERFWAKGYAHESAAEVMNYGRTSLGLRRIAATTATEELRFHSCAGKTGPAIRKHVSPQGTTQKRLTPEGRSYRRRF
jgi:ribosomal-protein-alanine N-acetyltransferase